MKGRIWGVWALLGVGVSVVACGSGAPPAAITEDLRYIDADGVTIHGEHVFLNAEGFRSSHLVFDTMYHWKDSLNYHLRSFDLVVFDEVDGTERAHVTAERGTMDERGDRFWAQGNVVLLIAEDGRRLESGELHYDPQADQIWSDSLFVMTVPGRNPIRGRSFRSDLAFENFSSVGMGN